jgi:hypothetical protein
LNFIIDIAKKRLLDLFEPEWYIKNI